MTESHSLKPWLKWFSIVWTVSAAAIILISNLMIANGWPHIGGVPPFDVRNDLRVALLLAPGLIAAILDWTLFGRNK
jgi:hypothetical protein